MLYINPTTYTITRKPLDLLRTLEVCFLLVLTVRLNYKLTSYFVIVSNQNLFTKFTPTHLFYILCYVDLNTAFCYAICYYWQILIICRLKLHNNGTPTHVILHRVF